MRAMLGLDLGGTQIKSGLVFQDGRIDQIKRTPTPQNDPTGNEAITVLSEIANSYSGFEAIGLVLPGLVDAKAGVCQFSGTLGWRDFPAAKLLEEKTKKSVFLEHDVTASGLAELRVGAAKGVDRAAVIAIGTALAAALIIDGEVFHPHPSVGEVGHAPIPNNRRCVCGKTGCVEMTVSGGGLQRNYLALSGKELSAPEIIELAQSGDPSAKKLVDEFVYSLGFTITWLASTIAPEVIVIAGGISSAGDYLTQALDKELSEQIGIQLRPEIRISTLEGTSGCIGAGLAAHERLSN